MATVFDSTEPSWSLWPQIFTFSSGIYIPPLFFSIIFQHYFSDQLFFSIIFVTNMKKRLYDYFHLSSLEIPDLCVAWFKDIHKFFSHIQHYFLLTLHYFNLFNIIFTSYIGVFTVSWTWMPYSYSYALTHTIPVIWLVFLSS